MENMLFRQPSIQAARQRTTEWGMRYGERSCFGRSRRRSYWAYNSLKIIGYKRSRFFETVAGITPGGRDNRSGKGRLLHRSIVDGSSKQVGE